jgi:hypothetical protein
MVGTSAAAARIFIVYSKNSKSDIRLNLPRFKARKKSITSKAERVFFAFVFETPAAGSIAALSEKYDFVR